MTARPLLVPSREIVSLEKKKNVMILIPIILILQWTLQLRANISPEALTPFTTDGC